MMAFVVLAMMVGIAGLLRVAPHLLAPRGLGVDHWFWKAYIEKFRASREFPPVLPQFLLDEKQWYPPLFPLLVSQLPNRVFDRFSHLLAIVIDLFRMVLLLLVVWLFSGRFPSVIAAAVIYATTPILVTYNVQLNPRGLGALFLDGVAVLLVWVLWHDGTPWIWVVIVVLSALILLMHKMTTQLFWFLAVSVGVMTHDWRIVALVPLSIVSAIVMSRGFYWKVLRAHWDIVTFWARNWRWLGAHPVLESPLYGDPDYETPTKFFRSGLRGHIRRLLYVIGFNPWAWAAIAVFVPMHSDMNAMSREDMWVALWVGLILGFVLLTTYVPFLRCLGSGYLYLYNSAFPTALFIGMTWGGSRHDWTVNVILAGTLATCAIGLAFYLHTLYRSRTLKVDENLNRALEQLRAESDGVVMCLPQHWHDVVAYRTGKPVLFGAHGYGFRHIEAIFPRFLRPVAHVISEFNVRYLITFKGYLPDRFLDEVRHLRCIKSGEYLIYVIY